MALEPEVEKERYHCRFQLSIEWQEALVKKNVLKNKNFSRKRCCDLLMTESVVDKRTTMAFG